MKGEARDVTDGMTLDHDLAPGGDGAQQLLAIDLVQPAHEVRGAAVDEAGGQPLMQRVRQQVLDLARAGLPGGSIAYPVGAGGDVGPGADARQPGHERIDVAVGAGQGGDASLHPFGRHAPVLRDVREHAGA